MPKVQKSTAIYKTPFSKAYWRDAASELKDTKMLVVTALMIAIRIALKPLAIPLGPQLSIQTAMLATALGAMISDTIGFMIYPTGDYFLPFMLTEIASTMIYAIFLYRAQVTPTRVMLSRFCIGFFVNVVLQQFIYAWWYVYVGNPEEAKESILGIMTLSRILKNVCMFPLESVVLTLFLKMLLPVVRRAKLVHCADADMKITGKQIVALVLLTVIGAGSATGYLAYRYTGTSRSADYSSEERVEANKAMAQVVLDNTDEWDAETVVCVVDSAYRPLFGDVTDYTVAVYVLDPDAFAAGQAAAAAEDKTYDMDTLWAYSKSGPKKDQYQSLIKVASADIVKNEDTGEILEFACTPVE